MNVRRLPIRLSGDDRRVIARPFILGAGRAQAILQRVDSLDESTVADLLDDIRTEYGKRHRRIDSLFEEHYRMAATMVSWKSDWSSQRRLLAGGYFTMEYSVDAAALFNPSIVAHPDQSNIPYGALRFVMSLRATGEGHVSSVAFRTGLITAEQQVEIDPVPPLFHRARFVPDRQYVKPLFTRKLAEIGVKNKAVEGLMAMLGDAFTMADLTRAIEEIRPQHTDTAGSSEALRAVHWLAGSNYHIDLAAEASLSELVIFPMNEEESHGIEDLRLVRFLDEDQPGYYGTYTAYNGVRTLPMMINTRDFKRIEVHSLNGPGAANKGMAIFPRRVGGHYVMCSRIDGENLYISFSDSAYFWGSSTRVVVPRYAWEFVQIGNCGSPLETEAGWLMLTHGVGPMRSYAIGAVLLDKDDPLKVVGHLSQPLITPLESEREGYVPNVVYTCGAIIHGDLLFIPYASADTSTTMAVVELAELLNRLRDQGA